MAPTVLHHCVLPVSSMAEHINLAVATAVYYLLDYCFVWCFIRMLEEIIFFLKAPSSG